MTEKATFAGKSSLGRGRGTDALSRTLIEGHEHADVVSVVMAVVVSWGRRQMAAGDTTVESTRIPRTQPCAG
jgi:hypothetical protein